MSQSLPDSSNSQLTDWLRPNLRWITVPSWLMSGIFHVVLAGVVIVLSQLPACRGDIGGEEGESFRDVGIHVRSSSSEDESDAEPEGEQPATELVYENPLDVAEPQLDQAPPVELALPQMDLPIPRIGVGSIPVQQSSTGDDLVKPNESTFARPTANGSGNPVAGGTSFLGIEDVGRRFSYVIDRSFSMDNDGALQAAKAELLASLIRLNESQQFQVIFYSGTVEVLKPRDGRFDMFWGTDTQRMQVSGRLRSIFAQGGTNHFPAVMAALEGNPDVIFLLTDGAADTALSRAELTKIKQRNRGGTRIHTIEFGRSANSPLDGEGNFLKELSRQNQGKYVYRNVKRNRL